MPRLYNFSDHSQRIKVAWIEIHIQHLKRFCLLIWCHRLRCIGQPWQKWNNIIWWSNGVTSTGSSSAHCTREVVLFLKVENVPRGLLWRLLSRMLTVTVICRLFWVWCWSLCCLSMRCLRSTCPGWWLGWWPLGKLGSIKCFGFWVAHIVGRKFWLKKCVYIFILDNWIIPNVLISVQLDTVLKIQSFI